MDDDWNDYLVDRTADAESRLLERYRGLVAALAQGFMPMQPSPQLREEILSDGMIALMHCIRKFEPELASFEHYAGSRIKFAIQDGFRARDILSRGLRKSGAALRGTATIQTLRATPRINTDEELEDSAEFFRTPEEIEILKMRLIDGYTISEIARLTGIAYHVVLKCVNAN